jgi:hypothetical protein
MTAIWLTHSVGSVTGTRTIFQRKLTEAVGDLNGTFTIADDIIIAGCGQTDEEAKRDHETKLCKLYARCKEQNSILNDKKKEIGLKESLLNIRAFASFESTSSSVVKR